MKFVVSRLDCATVLGSSLTVLVGDTSIRNSVCFSLGTVVGSA